MKRAGWIGAMAALLSGAVAMAQAPAAPAGAPAAKPATPDARVTALLQEVEAAYRKLSSIHVRMQPKITTPDPAMQQAAPGAMELWFQQPGRYRISVSPGAKDAQTPSSLVVCDGKTIWQYSGKTNTYTQTPASPAMLQLYLQQTLPEGSLLVGGSASSLLPPPVLAAAHIAEPRKVGDIPVDVISGSFSQPGAEMQMSIEVLVGQVDRMVHGFHVSGKSGKAGPGPGSYDLAITNEVLQPNPRLTDADFQFTPPAGAKLQVTPKPTPARAGTSGKKPAAKPAGKKAAAPASRAAATKAARPIAKPAAKKAAKLIAKPAAKKTAPAHGPAKP